MFARLTHDRLRRTALAFAVAALAGCATAPAGGPPLHGSAPARLALCPGMTISNPPASDDYRYIVAYTPTATLRGRTLLRAPVNGCVSSAFGPRQGGAGSVHEGVDLYTRTPAPIVAAGDGVIRRVATMRAYGRTIDIDHGNGVATRYAHLSRFADGLSVGDRVARGAALGETGRSGNATAVHLHFEILVDGRPVDPLHAGTGRAGF